jgi:hypothetical protein
MTPDFTNFFSFVGDDAAFLHAGQGKFIFARLVIENSAAREP